jgi:hypothetical protein
MDPFKVWPEFDPESEFYETDPYSRDLIRNGPGRITRECLPPEEDK